MLDNCRRYEMKQILKMFVIIVISVISVQEISAKTLQGNISLIENVPQNFYGTWLVTGTMISTNIENMYSKTAVDVWTLTKYGNIIVLANPVSGAYASISVNEVDGNKVKFTRTSTNSNQSSFEEPIINLNGDNFEGVDKMIIKHLKNGKIVRTDELKYKINGQKIASESLFLE